MVIIILIYLNLFIKCNQNFLFENFITTTEETRWTYLITWYWVHVKTIYCEFTSCFDGRLFEPSSLEEKLDLDRLNKCSLLEKSLPIFEMERFLSWFINVVWADERFEIEFWFRTGTDTSLIILEFGVISFSLLIESPPTSASIDSIGVPGMFSDFTVGPNTSLHVIQMTNIKWNSIRSGTKRDKQRKTCVTITMRGRI